MWHEQAWRFAIKQGGSLGNQDELEGQSELKRRSCWHDCLLQRKTACHQRLSNH